jgi:hypothetical protein
MFELSHYENVSEIGTVAESRGRFGSVERLEAVFADGRVPVLLYTRTSPPFGRSRIWFGFTDEARKSIDLLLSEGAISGGSSDPVTLSEIGDWGDRMKIDAELVDGTLQLSFIRKRFPWPRKQTLFRVEREARAFLTRLAKGR